METNIRSAEGGSAQPEPALEGLLAKTGRLLLQWSLLDEALIADIRRLRSEGGDLQTTVVRVRGSFSERLAEWRALLSLKSRRNPQLAEAVLEAANQIERLRQKRNQVAHHFAGVSARPEDGEPSIFCVEGDRGASNVASIRITQTELTRLIEEIDLCRRRVSQIEETSG